MFFFSVLLLLLCSYCSWHPNCCNTATFCSKFFYFTVALSSPVFFQLNRYFLSCFVLRISLPFYCITHCCGHFLFISLPTMLFPFDNLILISTFSFLAVFFFFLQFVCSFVALDTQMSQDPHE